MTNEEIFAARIARIQAGAENTKGTIFVGQDERHHLGRPETKRPAKGTEAARNTLYPLSLIGAFGLGLLAVALGSYARFQLMAGQDALEDADLEMAISGVIGLALSFVLAQLFRLTSKEHKGMQGAGVFVMVCAFHNLAFWAPGPMSALFSPAYVAGIQAEAPPNSARIRGAYFALFEQDSTAAAELTPQYIRDNAATCAGERQKVRVLQMDSEGRKGGKTGCENG